MKGNAVAHTAHIMRDGNEEKINALESEIVALP